MHFTFTWISIVCSQYLYSYPGGDPVGLNDAAYWEEKILLLSFKHVRVCVCVRGVAEK
jgi:hypothetical protein